MLLLRCMQNNKYLIVHALINHTMVHRPMTMLYKLSLIAPDRQSPKHQQSSSAAKDLAYGQRKWTWGTPAQVLSKTPAHWKSNNEIRPRNLDRREAKTRKSEKLSWRGTKNSLQSIHSTGLSPLGYPSSG